MANGLRVKFVRLYVLVGDILGHSRYYNDLRANAKSEEPF